jgi:hypothetical protein
LRVAVTFPTSLPPARAAALQRLLDGEAEAGADADGAVVRPTAAQAAWAWLSDHAAAAARALSGLRSRL